MNIALKSMTLRKSLDEDMARSLLDWPIRIVEPLRGIMRRRS
jgi:hypothetical protein